MSQPRFVKSTILAAAFFASAFSPVTRIAAGQSATVTIDTAQTGQPISKYIYGQFIEHLGRCIYGGIWAEMLEDRKFYFPVTAEYNPYRGTRAVPKDSPYAVVGASPWQIIGSPDSVTMVKADSFVGEHTPLIEQGAGIRQRDLALIAKKKYVGTLYLKSQLASTKVRVSLRWGEGSDNSQSVQFLVTGQAYGNYPFAFTSAADTNQGMLEIHVLDGTSFVGTVSLMPEDNIEGMRADTLAMLRELNAPLYRWPGGNFVSGYDWRDGIGPRDRRPPRKNPAWTGVEHNDFGMHEFIRFCRILEAEPLITVNTGFGDAYSAAAELEYSNGSTETLMGALRARNGVLEPFNVRYWCIGNEMWGRWQLGYMSLNHYVQKHNWIVDKMREVDPDIIPIASGNAGEWSEGLLKNCADHIDQIAEHFYCQERPDVVKHTAWIAENIRSKAQFHRKLRKELDTLKGKDIQIAMTEWNYWYGPHLFGELGTRYFHKDGIGIARGLHEFYRQSDIMVMANYAQTVNVIGCIKASKTAAALETTGLVLKLYGNNYGSIPVGSTCDTGSLDVSAALTPDRQALTLSIVNPTDKTHLAKLDIRGVELAGTGRLGCIVHSDPQAHNDPDQAPQVVIEEKDLAVVTNAFEVPALSINLYTLPVK